MKKIIWILVFLISVSLVCGLEAEIEDSAGLINTAIIKQKINSISVPGKIVIKTAKRFSLEDIENAEADIGAKKERIILILYEEEKDNLHFVFNRIDQFDEASLESLSEFLSVFRIGAGGSKEYYTQKFIELIEFTVSVIAPSAEKAPAEKQTPANVKNMDLYTDKTVFIISDKMTSFENWDEILSFIPVTIWRKSGEACNEVSFDELELFTIPKCAYPYLIYHEEEEGVDADAIINFVSKYNPDKIYHVGFPNTDRINKLLSSVVDDSKIEIKSVSDYFSFWKERNIIVLSENSYEIGLIAAVYASYLNAPLIFDKAYSSSVIKGREVHTIGKVDLVSVEHNAKEFISFENPTDALLTLQYKMGISPDRVIITNPNDIKEDAGVFEDVGFTRIYPERHYEEIEMNTLSGRTHKQYYQNSLIAPYLAVAKDEILILLPKEITAISFDPTDLPGDWDETALLKEKAAAVKTAVMSGYESTTNQDITKSRPLFFTIIGSPRSIYLSYFKDLVKIGSKFRPAYVVADRFYFDFNGDGLEDGNVGRIAGNIPDVSSVIASSVFLDRLVPKKTRFFGIGNSYTYSENLVSNVANALKQKNVDSACFIADKYYNAGGVCTASSKIPPDKPPLEQFEKSNFIFFAGKGNAYKWGYALNSRDIPDLNLAFGLAAADTNEYYPILSKDNQLPFGLTWLRKGGIAYVSSIKSEKDLLENLCANIFLNKFSSDKYLGEILRESVAAAGKSESGYARMVLLGDPTIRLPYELNIDLPFAWAYFTEDPFAFFPELSVGITSFEAVFRLITFSDEAIADITLDISELQPTFDSKPEIIKENIDVKKMREIALPKKELSKDTGINTSLNTGIYAAEWIIKYIEHNFYLAKAVITTEAGSKYTAYFKPFGAEYQKSEEVGE